MQKLRLSIYYIQEINYRLAYTALGTLLIFITTYKYKQGLIFLILPQGLSHFVSAGLTEIFFTYVEISTLISLNLSIILIILQTYFFLRPGLYKYETKIIFNLFTGAICFYISLYILIFPIIIKILWEVFTTYSQNFTPIHLTFEPKLNEYLNHIQQINKILVCSFPCILGLSLFQKYTNKNLLIKYRSIAYILFFFLAAFITPPDLLSQTFIGLPLIFIFEMQIIFWAFYKEYKKTILVINLVTNQILQEFPKKEKINLKKEVKNTSNLTSLIDHTYNEVK
uniref:SecY-independent transporter protein n=1 Tax=Pleurocladia lacustris TaxID=246121 RepID=A0A1I9LW40_9PHAE|nr:SecY-independent transporter protein [Pleurocladia lacustris]ANS57810.1 SecY-independent transporter protein [Pleurocladia lacustris]